MTNNVFYRLGKGVYRVRWFVIAFLVCLILVCVPILPKVTSTFKTTGFVDTKSESAKAIDYMDEKLGYNNYNKFIIMYRSKTLLVTDPLFNEKIKRSLEDLDSFPIKNEIIYPESNPDQISKDKHTAYAVVILKQKDPINTRMIHQFKNTVKKPTHMSIQFGGEPIFVDDVNKQTEKDLLKADAIAAPLAIIILIFVFGSVVAAVLPLILGGGCAIIVLTILHFLGQIISLSVFTLNIAMLLCLCLTLDYCLFIINRYRDELKNGCNVIEAIGNTQATAGRAVFFSGIAVFASLSALLLFPVNILISVAVGGLTAVLSAMIAALIFLPAILGILKTSINRYSLCFRKKTNDNESIWSWLTKRVIKHPLYFFISILILLLLLGYPFLNVKLGISDFKIFPERSENREFFDDYAKKFKEQELTPILIIAQSYPHSILSNSSISKLDRLTHKLKNDPRVYDVNSIVNTEPQLSKEQYYALYSMPKKQMNPNIKKLLDATTRHYLTVISVVSKYSSNSEETQQLIKELKHMKVKGLTLKITGSPVTNFDVLKSIYHTLPYAIFWILSISYFVLLLLLRSIVLPFKAIITNLLSLAACFGALVFVFQEGHFHEALMFQPQNMLDISLIVIIFCALFGFSMDYEVFLLSRIKETYLKTKNTNQSILLGIEKSGKVITSAAVIVIFVCGAFLIADILMVKAFGLGIAVAIFVDAFLIRTLLVPATMVLLGDWNWYFPKFLKKLFCKE